MNGKRQGDSSNNPKRKKGRRSRTSTQNEEVEESAKTPVLVHRIDYTTTNKERTVSKQEQQSSVPSIPLNPDLDNLLFPLKRDEFLKTCLRKRAVHITCMKGQEEKHEKIRIEQIRKEMFDLDAESILRETSSDNIFIWLRKKTLETQSSSSSSSAAAAVVAPHNDLIQSIEVSDVETAIALHKVGGHATYCRAPPKVEQLLVSSLLRSTGLGCGQYDPTGESMTTWGRGEVETFLSTNGHVTNWHFDFQENFTIQLSGIKKWTLQQGMIQDPIRGCTPHYASPETVESQLKAAHLIERKFQFGHPTTGINAIGDVQSIILRPGDTFYFPAGMWHKVETIQPGVSINVSLMATNYATVVSQAIQHILHTLPHWRQPILHNGIHNSHTDLSSLLKNLPNDLTKILSAESIIPPILQHAPNFQSTTTSDSDNEDDEEEEDCGEEMDQPELSAGESDEEKEDDDDIMSRMEDMSSAVEEDHDEVIDPREFHGYPKEWEVLPRLTKGVKMTFHRNPFAILHRMDEITRFYQTGKTIMADGEDDEEDSPSNCVFVLNVNYAGNETHQSSVRIVFCDSDNDIVQRLFTKFESSSASMPSHDRQQSSIDIEPTDDDLPHLNFLLFHGYVILTKEQSPH